MEKLAQKLGLGVDILSEALMGQIWIDFIPLMFVLAVMLFLAVGLGIWAHEEEERFGVILSIAVSVLIATVMAWKAITIIYNPIYYAISLMK